VRHPQQAMALDNTSFSTLELPEALTTSLASLGYESMTSIQLQALPSVLDGQDVIGQAKTGSGKTAVFALGILSKLDTTSFNPQAMVLCPTRELADQVATEIRKLARTTHNVKVLVLTGGSPLRKQAESLTRGAHILVGTPGRIDDLLRNNKLRLNEVTTLVLDEADRMLDMGFFEVIEQIVEQVPTARQTLLFSATFPAQIKAIAKRVMVEPVTIEVATTHDETSIEQHVYQVAGDKDRMTALRLLLLKQGAESALVFCNTKREAQQVADDLRGQGFSALALHGDLEQRDRDQTLLRFANQSASVLVATDVAARGLDIDVIGLVINYHLARETEVHLHRVGRTGRAGNKGVACTLVGNNESRRLALLGEHYGRTFDIEPLPPSHWLQQTPPKAPMVTLLIDGGKKQKIRAGDILGALTGTGGIAGGKVGKINIFDNQSYVAVAIEVKNQVLSALTENKLKGRSIRARLVQGQAKTKNHRRRERRKKK